MLLGKVGGKFGCFVAWDAVADVYYSCVRLYFLSRATEAAAGLRLLSSIWKMSCLLSICFAVGPATPQL